MKRCALVSREAREGAKGFGFTAEAQRTRRGSLVSREAREDAKGFGFTAEAQRTRRGDFGEMGDRRSPQPLHAVAGRPQTRSEIGSSPSTISQLPSTKKFLSAFRSRRLPAAGYRNSLNPISYLLTPARLGLLALTVLAATGWGQLTEGFESGLPTS